jgi:hypothetical protein
MAPQAIEIAKNGLAKGDQVTTVIVGSFTDG